MLIFIKISDHSIFIILIFILKESFFCYFPKINKIKILLILMTNEHCDHLTIKFCTHNVPFNLTCFFAWVMTMQNTV